MPFLLWAFLRRLEVEALHLCQRLLWLVQQLIYIEIINPLCAGFGLATIDDGLACYADLMRFTDGLAGFFTYQMPGLIAGHVFFTVLYFEQIGFILLLIQ